MKKFHHYPLGCAFTLVTDHAPLQWLSAQKMEGLLSRWPLAIQEYDFKIAYQNGQRSGNTTVQEEGSQFQMCNGHHSCTVHCNSGHPTKARKMTQLFTQLFSNPHTTTTRQHMEVTPLWRYGQLWPQLVLTEGDVCCQYSLGPRVQALTVPIIPASLCNDAS